MEEHTKKVAHQQGAQQFVIALEGEPAFMAYELGKDGTLMVMHTEVPEAYNGQGYASQLAKAVLAYAAQQELKVMPYCTYMAVYLRRHKKEYQALVSPEFDLEQP